jgi:hypothetical protein
MQHWRLKKDDEGGDDGDDAISDLETRLSRLKDGDKKVVNLVI